MFVLEYVLPVLSGVCMIVIAIFILSKFLYRKSGFSPVLVGVVAVVFSVVQVYFNTFQMSWLNYLALCTAFTIIIHIFFKGNFALKFGFSVIVTTIGGLSEMVIVLIPTVLSELQFTALLVSPIFLAVVGFLVPLVFLFLGLFIAKMFPRKYESFKWSELYLISFQILFIASHTAMIHYSAGVQLSFAENLAMLFLNIALLVSSLLIFFIFDSALHKRELEKQIEVYQYQFEQIKESQAVIGRIEHDIEKHLLALKLDLKNAMPAEAEQKIDALIGNLRLAENIADSGNADVDAILNYKAMQASTFGIRMACDLRLPYTLNINTTDLTIVLGNAIDNAIEACKTVESSEREINISINYDKHNLSMTITNPFTGEIKTDAAGELVTTKTKGRHGIGLKSIQETVEKYDGLMDISAENNRFTLKILLFNLSSQ